MGTNRRKKSRKVSPAKAARQQCAHCERWFGNGGALGRHETTAHSPNNPEWAKKVRESFEKEAARTQLVIEAAPEGADEELNLSMEPGETFNLGDTFYHVRKFVVLRTERSTFDGVPSKTMKVSVKCLKRHYQRNSPK